MMNKFWLLFMFPSLAVASGMLEKRLADESFRRPDSLFKVWVFFQDAPMEHGLDALRSRGFRVRHISRWFNAASGEARGGSLPALEKLPFVKSLKSVRSFRTVSPRPLRAPEGLRKGEAWNDYGPCFDQLNIITLVRAHLEGLVKKDQAGKGVRIALLDSGFETALQVFSHFTPSTIIARRDYVAGMVDTSILFDTTVNDDSLDRPGQEEHGTSVLSLIAGYWPDAYMGVAPFASFALLKTERIGNNFETLTEEDAWVAACEWVVDSVGIDILTSSLGYHYDFTDGRADYTAAELNGDSLLITQAADKAAEKGVAVFVSAGNEGDSGLSSLCAPSDGDSVMAVGGCNRFGDIYEKTSYGPTGDGRKKPDICAPGDYVYVAESYGGFSFGSGTSFASPMAAGVGALLLQADTSYRGRPMALLDKMKQHAYFPESISPADRQDPRYGAGIVNAYAALLDVLGLTPPKNIPSVNFFIPGQPCRDHVTFSLTVPNTADLLPVSAYLRIRVYTLSGKLVAEITRRAGDIALGVNPIEWDGRSASGEKSAPGVYLVFADYREAEQARKIWKTKFTFVR